MLTEPQRQALHEPADRGRLAQLAAELARLLNGGWTCEELRAHVGAELPGSWRSPARILWARAQALPTAPPDPEALRAAADAVRIGTQIQAARCHASNQAAVEFLDAAEIVARLAQCYSGEVLAAAVAVVAECRPGEDVEQAVRDVASSAHHGHDAHDGCGDPREAERGRRGSASSTGPVTLGRLLPTIAEGGP